MITDAELAAFKAHLVATGEEKQVHVNAVAPVKRDWENLLWGAAPDLFPDGKFEEVLRAALEDFVRHRATPYNNRLDLQAQVEKWLATEGRAGRFRTARQAPMWKDYEEACKAEDVAVAFYAT